MIDDILDSMKEGKVAALIIISLDISVAFDMVVWIVNRVLLDIEHWMWIVCRYFQLQFG